MHQLIYTSRSVRAFTVVELSALLAKSRAKNSAAGITGCLLHIDGTFLQVLEGDAARVQTVYQNIAKDDRHAWLVVLLRRDIERQFHDWSMGLVEASDHTETFDGYHPSTGFADLAGNTARLTHIVDGLRAGHWRNAA